MILAIAFAHVWGVIQLIVLGSLSRTVRVRTVLAALAVGLYAIGPLTVLLQLGWIHLAASLMGTPVADVRSIASYTVDPFLEEALKLLPLTMLLLLIPAVRRQWSVMDCVLIAAATGSGYGLAENLYRYAGSPHAAHAVAGGWAIVIGKYMLLVPGVMRTVTSLFPAGTVFVDETIRVNSHLVWSALGGLAVGLIIRHRTRATRLIAGGLLLYVGLDHAAGNAALQRDTWLGHLAPAFHALATVGAGMVLVALTAAWWLDRPAQSAGATLDPLLTAERTASSRFAGTLKAASSRLPWSILWVPEFARARRAYHAAHAAASAGPDALLAAVVAHRDRVDRQLAQAESPRLLPSGLTPAAVRSTLRRPAVVLSLVLVAPSILFLVVGGFPQTAAIQAAMRAPLAWSLILVITVLAQSRMAWSVIAGARNWSKTRRLPMADDAAIVGLQLACGVGAVGLAGFTLMRVLGGVSAGSPLLSSAHGADAANRVDPDGALNLSNGAGPVVSSGEPDGDVNADTGPAGPEADAPPVIHGETDTAASLGAAAGADLGESLGADVDAESDFPAPPKPSPEDVAAAQADARAAKAEADAREAEQVRKKALDAQDAADIARSTADPGYDPTVAAARERTHQANAESEAADRGALDPDDPWDPNAPNKTAADIAHKAAREAADDQRAAENAYDQRMAKEADEAKAAAGVAEQGMNEANVKAAEAREEASNAHYAAARAADPLGTAADNADKNYAAAKAREAKAWEEPDTGAYHDARQAAMLAKQQADAARAAANAARDARSASVTPVDKP
jgi:PrsW family intramembrane metalloprotease